MPALFSPPVRHGRGVPLDGLDGHAELLEPNQLLRNGQNTSVYATHGEYGIWGWDKTEGIYRSHLVRQYFNEAKVGVNFN